RGQRVALVGGRDGHALAPGVEGDEVRQRLRDGQVLAPLDVLDVFQDLRVRQGEVGVFETFVFGFRPYLLSLFHYTRIDAIGQARGHRLAGEAVDHVVDGIGLIGLDLEFELHGAPSDRLDVGGGRELAEDLFDVDLHRV